MNPGPADGTDGTDGTHATAGPLGLAARLSGRAGTAVAVVALAVAYGVAGWLGLLVASDPGNVTALWPPSGIALASLLLGGRRLWPGVLLGAFTMNVVMFPAAAVDGAAILGAGLIALGSTVEIVLAATLIDRVDGRRLLQSPRYLVGFMVACAVAATVAATAGLTATVGIGGAAVDRLTFWSTWWIGDVVGMLVIGPVVCGGPLLVHRKAEWLLTVTLTVAVGEAVFNRPFGLLGGTTLPVVWLILPAVMWSATRLDPRAIAIHTLLIHVLASWGTVAGFGPLAGHGGVGLVILDGLLIVTNATGLMLASTARQLDVANRTLEARVAERGRALEGAPPGSSRRRIACGPSSSKPRNRRPSAAWRGASPTTSTTS